jgi:hypothetical protein
MRPENFIYFLTVSGFFIGLIFSILSGLEAFMIFLSSIIISVLFYMIGLGSAGMFIKYVDQKAGYNINRNQKEEFLDKIIVFLEKREKYIQDSHHFIENLEREFLSKKDEGLAVDKK